MRANAEVKWAVYKAIDALFDHIANGRKRETLACFTGDDDAALIGSDAGEEAVGPKALDAFFEELYAQPYRVLLNLPDRRVSVAGQRRVVHGRGHLRAFLRRRPQPYRLTGVLERRRDVWLWQLFSGSEPR